MKKLLFVMVLLWGGGGLGLWYYNETQAQHFSYRTVPIARGDLQATINATGTIEPQEVVDVGAQIAGEIVSFGTDPQHPEKAISFLSPVEQGTVLARIADRLFKARVDQMKASVERSEAEVLQAQAKFKQTRRELDRSNNLVRDRRVSLTEHDAAVANDETAEASLALSRSAVALARANLEEAEVNLSYTTIKSPVKGVIIDRRVNIGQTVVSSLNAPSLFLIAKDLSRMEIWASVNETDIGLIHPGQEVRFTAASLPSETLRGTVAQIRPNASMVQSVVIYTVAIDIDNTSGRLHPYESARVQFEVENRKGILLVPNAALRWKPKPAQVIPTYRDEYARASRSRAAENSGGGSPAAAGKRTATLWARAGEFVRPVETQVGLTDGVRTEVEAGGDLIDGSQVVIGQAQAGEAGDEAATTGPGAKSPFLPDIKRRSNKK